MAPDQSACLKKSLRISQPKYMLWVLKRNEQPPSLSCHISRHNLFQVCHTQPYRQYARIQESLFNQRLTLNVPIETKVVCFSRLLKC